MEQHLSLIEKSPLFRGVAKGDVLPLLQDLKVRQKTIKKGSSSFIPVNRSRISAWSWKVQFISSRKIIGAIGISCRKFLREFFFGEAFACLPEAPATVDVVASADAVILQIYVQGVLHGGHMLTPAEAQFTGNILGLMAEKNRLLTEKNALPDPALDAAEDHALLVEPGAG